MQIIGLNDVTRTMIMTKICNRRSRYVPPCKKNNIPYTNTDFSTCTVTPTFTDIDTHGYIFIFLRSLVTSFASVPRPETKFNFCHAHRGIFIGLDVCTKTLRRKRIKREMFVQRNTDFSLNLCVLVCAINLYYPNSNNSTHMFRKTKCYH